MNTTINTTKNIGVKITMIRDKHTDKYTDKYFESGMQALIHNNIALAVRYLKKSILCGNKQAYTYCNFIRQHKDKALAKDIVLCAERRI